MESQDKITLAEAKARQCIKSLTNKLHTGMSVTEAHQQVANELEVENYMTFHYLNYLSRLTDAEVEDLLIAYVNAVKNANDKTVEKQSEKTHASVIITIEPLLVTREQYHSLNIIEQSKLIKKLLDRYQEHLGWTKTLRLITEKLHISESTIKSRIKLIDLPEEMQQLLIQKRIRIQKALDWLKDNNTPINPKAKTGKPPKKAKKTEEIPIPPPGTKCHISSKGAKECAALVGRTLTVVDHSEDEALKQIVRDARKKQGPVVIITTPGEGPRPSQICPVPVKYLT